MFALVQTRPILRKATVEMKYSFLTLLVFLGCSAVLAAKPVDIPEEKLHIDIPADWTTSPAAGMLLRAVDSQNRSSIVLLSIPNDTQASVETPDFVKGFKEGMSKKIVDDGGSVGFTQEGPLSIHGVPFYGVQGVFKPATGNATYFHSYVTAANGKAYIFELLSLDSNMDSQFNDIANSIVFQGTPVVPDPNQGSDEMSRKLGEVAGLLLLTIRWLARLGKKKAVEPPPFHHP
jgi:hypothetical protein